MELFTRSLRERRRIERLPAGKPNAFFRERRLCGHLGERCANLIKGLGGPVRTSRNPLEPLLHTLAKCLGGFLLSGAQPTQAGDHLVDPRKGRAAHRDKRCADGEPERIPLHRELVDVPRVLLGRVLLRLPPRRNRARRLGPLLILRARHREHVGELTGATTKDVLGHRRAGRRRGDVGNPIADLKEKVALRLELPRRVADVNAEIAERLAAHVQLASHPKQGPRQGPGVLPEDLKRIGEIVCRVGR